ncbi:MAG: hypothetical protein LBP85_07210 [Prevotellaceae bacterium]|jgi:hypothetical protein|nr:hypothetical protein [Prevotellaceae bacterium]
MKKILLLLSITLFAACGKDDVEAVQYSEEKGYLTTLESVKYGIVGTWRVYYNNENCQGYSQLVFDKNKYINSYDMTCMPSSSPVSGIYEIYEENGKFYININDTYVDDVILSKMEISLLNKTNLKIPQFSDIIYTRQ